jgi:hypothetical protein
MNSSRHVKGAALELDITSFCYGGSGLTHCVLLAGSDRLIHPNWHHRNM